MDALLAVSTAPVTPGPGHFSGHETFAFRYAWMKKGFDALSSRPDIFNSEEAMGEMGVGKNMVRSIRHWCLATTVFQEDWVVGTGGGRTRKLVPSDFGRKIFSEAGYDPFLEDDATLWLLHWHLVNNPVRAFTWFYVFNRVKEPEFTRDGLSQALLRVTAESGTTRLSESSLKSDISCFLRTYVPGKRGPLSTLEETLDCPLSTLNLLREVITEGEGGARYRFVNGRKPGLSTTVFAYALADFWREYHPTQETLSLREIVHGEGGPGRVFRLDEDSVLPLLDRLHDATGGALEFRDSATIRQVARLRPISLGEALDAVYE